MDMNISEIELSHLRYFLVLAEELHFGRAAGRLHIAQPPLTRHIHLLEDRLGCVLFERTTRRTRLSAAGMALVPRARAIVAEAERTFAAVERVARGEAGELTVATAPSLMLGALPGVIRGYRKRYPGVRFRLLEMASSAILDAVRAGTADLGFVRGLDKDPEMETLLQWAEPMVAVVGRDHRLAKAGGAELRDLRAEPFVFFARQLGPYFYDEVMGYCRKAGFVPEVREEARQWSSVVSLVAAGLGVSVAPAPVAGLMPRAVRYLPLAGVRTSARVVGARGAGSGAARGHFLEAARVAGMG
jgi:DNA-binding transcriptional LysR family regulator